MKRKTLNPETKHAKARKLESVTDRVQSGLELAKRILQDVGGFPLPLVDIVLGYAQALLLFAFEREKQVHRSDAASKLQLWSQSEKGAAAVLLQEIKLHQEPPSAVMFLPDVGLVGLFHDLGHSYVNVSVMQMSPKEIGTWNVWRTYESTGRYVQYFVSTKKRAVGTVWTWTDTRHASIQWEILPSNLNNLTQDGASSLEYPRKWTNQVTTPEFPQGFNTSGLRSNFDSEEICTLFNKGANSATLFGRWRWNEAHENKRWTIKALTEWKFLPFVILNQVYSKSAVARASTTYMLHLNESNGLGYYSTLISFELFNNKSDNDKDHKDKPYRRWAERVPPIPFQGFAGTLQSRANTPSFAVFYRSREASSSLEDAENSKQWNIVKGDLWSEMEAIEIPMLPTSFCI